MQHLSKLRGLPDDWDGEGAPKPNVESLSRAKEVIDWALDRALVIEDVDADVLGGVAVWLVSAAGSRRRAWIACMNDGQDTLVLQDGSEVQHAPWGEASRALVTGFFASEERGTA